MNPYNKLTLNRTHRSRYFESPPDYAAVTRDREYEDGGKSFNRLNSVAPQEWELVYSGLLVQGGTNEVLIFDDHFDEKRIDTPFSFKDKFGVWHVVFYKSFERIHEAHKSWIQERRIVLIEYPGGSLEGYPDDSEPSAPEGFTLSFSGLTGIGECAPSTDSESTITEYTLLLSWG